MDYKIRVENELKLIEKTEMKTKEFLNIKADYILQVLPEYAGDDPESGLIEVPEGAESFNLLGDADNVFFLKEDNGEIFFSNTSNAYMWDVYGSLNGREVVLWKRESIDKNEQVLKEILEGILPEFEFEAIDAFIESNVEQRQKHSHYKKDVSHLNMIDIYRVTEMFKPHSCGAHIAKKALCSGQRGHKDLLTDIQDIIDTAERWKEMLIEDENSCKD